MTNFAVLVLLDTYNCLFSFSPSDHHAGASESEKREAENKFKEVGEAYEVLSDTKQKSRYDNWHDLDDLERGGGGFGGHEMDQVPGKTKFLFAGLIVLCFVYKMALNQIVDTLGTVR